MADKGNLLKQVDIMSDFPAAPVRFSTLFVSATGLNRWLKQVDIISDFPAAPVRFSALFCISHRFEPMPAFDKTLSLMPMG